MKVQGEKWWRYFEMPHENLMDRLSITFADLPLEIQKKVLAFEKVFSKASEDGIIDASEAEDLHKSSTHVSNAIIAYVQPPKEKSSGLWTGLLAVVGIAGLAVGVRQLVK